MKIFCLVFGAALVLAACQAPKGGGGGGGPGSRFQPSSSYQSYERRGMFSAGLRPIYPTDAKCLKIASYFGDTTRFDGSERKNDHYGYHGGMDISAREGTPLIAIAEGEVVNSGTGGRLVGNFVWLRLKPADTGLAVHVYAKYQHLEKPSELRIGDRVRIGQFIGPAGNTGTTGGYFGPEGYSHLHLTILVSDKSDFQVLGGKVRPANMRFLDPLGLFIADKSVRLDNHALRDLPGSKKRIPIAYKILGGGLQPGNARLIWPFACKGG